MDALNVQAIKEKVDQIVLSRRNFLESIEQAAIQVSERVEMVQSTRADLDRLMDKESDSDSREELASAIESLNLLKNRLDQQIQKLDILKNRFSRKTINIGVSGEARVGKSLTLQKLSGLSDTQIPTGVGLPVTAVRSEIYNTWQEEYAEVTFRDEQSFLQDFVAPHIQRINDCEQIKYATPKDIRSFSNITLPKMLGDQADPKALDSLKRLREAQESVEGYRSYLTGETIIIPLERLREFVAYPTLAEIESSKGRPKRKYLAVQHIKIYCRLPFLDGIKLALIDLPGMGEIDDTVALNHTRGLEENVDHILLVVKATNTEGYFKAGISEVVSQLQTIQPAISNRSDLITFANNIEKGCEQSAKSLHRDIDEHLNSTRKGKSFDIIDYDASDDQSVQKMIVHVLNAMSKHLPIMDQEICDDSFNMQKLEQDISHCLKNVREHLVHIKNSVPLPDEIMLEQIEAISKNIISSCSAYEVKLSEQFKQGAESPYIQEFRAQVKDIAANISSQINNGFFLGEERWRESARGQIDYFNFYRDECRRVRKEIIENYCDLDSYYTASTDSFKQTVLDSVMDNLGSLRSAYGVLSTDSPKDQIDKLQSKLSEELGRNTQLSDALALLNSVVFSFRNNVFLQVSKHLEELLNPTDTEDGKKRSAMGDPRIEPKLRINAVAKHLKADAAKANNNIKVSLLNCDDRYNEYLSVCIAFFNDYLYRRNEKVFEQVIIRRLLNIHGEEVIPDRENLASDKRNLTV